jgi:hypothetical protein
VDEVFERARIYTATDFTGRKQQLDEERIYGIDAYFISHGEHAWP